MRKVCAIGMLLIIMAGCVIYTRGSSSFPPGKEIANRVVVQIDSFSAVIHDRLLPAVQDRKADPQNIRQLFLESRLAYKRFEWAAEYFNPTITRNVNGPPVPEGELNGIAREPGGLQVIENYLYPKYDPGKRQQVIVQLKQLLYYSGNYKSFYQHTAITDAQVWDAARQEVFRVLALGLTSFDTPLAESSLNESSVCLRSVSEVLKKYPAGDGNSDLTEKFSKAISYLETATNFDKFDRATFLISYGDPLTAALKREQQRLNLPPIHSQRLLRQNAATLFDVDAFDAWAFSAYPEDGSSPERIVLGKRLFNDAMLSGTGTRSCASCHQAAKAFTDGMVKNISIDGAGSLPRNTPTLFNVAFQPAQFADLRASTLEGQAHDVIESKSEMRGSVKLTGEKLSRDTTYARLFAAAYPKSEKSIGQREITGALAAYVRTLSVLNSRFDNYMRSDRSAMNTDEVNGFNLFMGKARCGTCHYMPLFNGSLPPLYSRMDAEIIGVPADTKYSRIDDDEGRNAITHASADNHAFKTSTVRNAARTAPYMHNGVFATLEEVIDFYNNGGGVGQGLKIPNQTLSPDHLNLTDKEKKDLIAFIKCLDNQ